MTTPPMDRNNSLNQTQFYATAAYPCSYIEGRIARSQVVAPATPDGAALYSELVQHGFRRSGNYIYRPHCDHCKACKSIRVPVDKFRPDRSQRRAAIKHGSLVATISKPFFSPEHYALYQRYQKARHQDGGMDRDDISEYQGFLISTQMQSLLVEFRDTDSNGTLRMVSIIDELQDGLSAVYTFYEPVGGQSFGTFNVLWQIEHARSIGKAYLYLGYWIEDCGKMNYKTRFKPYELLMAGQWYGGVR
jgi:arginine-tRNA-protein transferase